MDIKSFAQQGYTVQVDVPVIVKREFFVELFVNNVFDSAEDCDGCDFEYHNWEKHKNERTYTVLTPDKKILKSGLKESQLEFYIKSI